MFRICMYWCLSPELLNLKTHFLFKMKYNKNKEKKKVSTLCTVRSEQFLWNLRLVSLLAGTHVTVHQRHKNKRSPVGEGSVYLPSVLKNIHYVVRCIMLHWGNSLDRYMCAVTMLQESLSMMACTDEPAHPQMFFSLVRFNWSSASWIVLHRIANFLFLCFSQPHSIFCPTEQGGSEEKYINTSTQVQCLRTMLRYL